MKLLKLPLFLLLMIFIASCASKKADVVLIPEPYALENSSEEFKIDDDLNIIVSDEDAAVEKVAAFYVEMLQGKNINAKIVKNDSKVGGKSLNLLINAGLDTLTAEGYVLSVDSDKIDVSASSAEGLYRAMSSLDQLISDDLTVKGVDIVDKPRFGWRGIMLDVARHFQPKDSVKKFIDILAFHKINKFHIHLTDGIGWRIEIDKYPKLTEKGAFRKVTPHSTSWENFELYEGVGDLNNPQEWYGGYFTKDDIKDIVVYASDRFIEVIPEIEMPGHSAAAIACYPEFTCPSAGDKSDVYCAGNDETFEFLSNILDEVFELFPSKYIHVGGDEVGRGQWLNCPLCKKRMKAEGIKDGEELQSYFMKRMDKFITSRGKKLLGWDEILDGGLPQAATVMSWTGFEGGIKAANAGHDVVMTPINHCYFDHYQGNNNFEPQAWGGYNSVENVYAFEPIPDGVDEDKRFHILGGQANLWTETVATQSHLEYMLLPRLTALCEVLWTQKDAKNWGKFKKKLYSQLDIYKKKGYNYAESAFTPLMTSRLLGDDTLEVVLDTEMSDFPIYYTLDGTEPTQNSELYTKPLILTSCTNLKAQTFRNGEKIGYLQEFDMLMNKATNADVVYENKFSESYSGGGEKALVDNKFAIKRGDSNLWQGVEKEDFVVTLDLKKSEEISKIVLGYFQHLSTTSVVLPLEIEVYASNNGENFDLVEKIENIKELNRNGLIKRFEIEKPAFKAQYIKVVSKNIGVLPEGYNRAGSNAWVFMDEISVN